MPRLSVTQRTRQKLNELLRDKRFSKSGLAEHCGKEPPWISNFLHPSPNRTLRPSFHLDELDGIAEYFDISIAELLGAPKVGELSGSEQRLLYAFRAIPAAVQAHVLALIELASLAPRHLQQRVLRPAQPQDIKQPTGDVTHDRALSLDPAAKLAHLQGYLTSIVVELGAAAAGQIPDRSTPSPATHGHRAGRVVD